MTDRELLQMALDALKECYDVQNYPANGETIQDDAIKALRARLAQPEPEPVFWYRPCADGMYEGPVHNNSVGGKMLRDEKPNEWQPLYTAPPQPESEPVAWVSSLDSAQPHCVTDLKYCTVLQHERGEHLKYIPVYTVPPQPKPEPVAWMWDIYNGAGYTSRGIDFYPTNIPFAKNTPLYTAPPQREWVDLTNDEIDDIWAEFNDGYGIIEETLWGYERALEAKLKEKNGG